MAVLEADKVSIHTDFSPDEPMTKVYEADTTMDALLGRKVGPTSFHRAPAHVKVFDTPYATFYSILPDWQVQGQEFMQVLTKSKAPLFQRERDPNPYPYGPDVSLAGLKQNRVGALSDWGIIKPEADKTAQARNKGHIAGLDPNFTRFVRHHGDLFINAVMAPSPKEMADVLYKEASRYVDPNFAKAHPEIVLADSHKDIKDYEPLSSRREMVDVLRRQSHLLSEDLRERLGAPINPSLSKREFRKLPRAVQMDIIESNAFPFYNFELITGLKDGFSTSGSVFGLVDKVVGEIATASQFTVDYHYGEITVKIGKNKGVFYPNSKGTQVQQYDLVQPTLEVAPWFVWAKLKETDELERVYLDGTIPNAISERVPQNADSLFGLLFSMAVQKRQRAQLAEQLPIPGFPGTLQPMIEAQMPVAITLQEEIPLSGPFYAQIEKTIAAWMSSAR